MSLGGGYQQAKSSNESGSLGPIGGGGNRTALQNPILDILTDRGFGTAPGQYGGGIFNQLFQRAQTPFQYQTPALTSTGLLQEQENALKQPFEQAVSQAMSRASGNFANRGFLRPENIQAIAGSAAQNVAPSFANLYANLASQNVGQRTQAPLVTEDLARQRFADLLNALGLGGTLLGGESSARGSSSSFGVQAQVSTGKP